MLFQTASPLLSPLRTLAGAAVLLHGDWLLHRNARAEAAGLLEQASLKASPCSQEQEIECSLGRRGIKCYIFEGLTTTHLIQSRLKFEPSSSVNELVAYFTIVLKLCCQLHKMPVFALLTPSKNRKTLFLNILC